MDAFGSRRDDPPHAAAVVALSGTQHGVISVSQLRALGFDKHRTARLTRKGWLTAVHTGVYAVGRRKLTRMGEILAAVLALGHEAAASHHSAAHVHELRRHERGSVHVTVPRSGARSRPGIEVHVSRGFRPVNVDGIPVTDATRTLTDLADVLPPYAVRLAVATAERKGLVDRATYVALPGRRRVMDAPHLFTRSRNERLLYSLCEREGLPLPLVNQDVDGWEVDFIWPERGLVLELDSYHTHGDVIAFERDRRKDEHLELHRGLTVRRVTDTRLHQRPDEVVALLVHALGRSPRDRAHAPRPG